MGRVYPWSAFRMYLRWRASTQPRSDAFATAIDDLLDSGWDNYQQPEGDDALYIPEARPPQTTSSLLKRWQSELIRLRLRSLHPEVQQYLPNLWHSFAIASEKPKAEEEESPWETCMRIYLAALQGQFEETDVAIAARFIDFKASLQDWIPAALVLGLPHVYQTHVHARPELQKTLDETLFGFRVPFINAHILESQLPPVGDDTWARMRGRIQTALYFPGESPESSTALCREFTARASRLSGPDKEHLLAEPETWYIAALLFAHGGSKRFKSLRTSGLATSLLQALAQPERARQPNTIVAQLLFVSLVAEQRFAIPSEVLAFVQDFLRPETPIQQAIPALAAGCALLRHHPHWEVEPPMPLGILISLRQLSAALSSVPLDSTLR